MDCHPGCSGVIPLAPGISMILISGGQLVSSGEREKAGPSPFRHLDLSLEVAISLVEFLIGSDNSPVYGKPVLLLLASKLS
jgi:hypothetical protein